MEICMKRSIILESTDGEIIRELVLSKVTTVRTHNEMFYLDKLGDGTWRLIYNEALIPDITRLSSLRIVRDNGAVLTSKGIVRPEDPELIEESEV
jgi:hypothetical protein